MLTEVEKDLALREQFKALRVVSKYKKRFVEDSLKEISNPEFPTHHVIFDIIMRLLEDK